MNDNIGFQKLSYTLTATPIIPILELTGFASDGIQWDKIQPAKIKKGADGLSAINKIPVVYPGTFTLQANSSSRKVLDNLIQLSTPDFGNAGTDYELGLVVTNKLTRETTIYSGGAVTEADSGDSANKDDGQADKTYKVEFATRTILPVS
ncbi:MAG: phage tail fiber protein [Alphaproteobacteria bacterium]